MNVSACNNTNPNFGMKFRFNKPKSLNHWDESCKTFFDGVQVALRKRKVEALEPKTDEFILNLDSPRFSVVKDSNNRYFTNNSYSMNVQIGTKDNYKKYDLSQKDILLSLLNPSGNLLFNPQGPYTKLLEFISKLK